MQWGDLITLEYGKPIKDKESANGPIPVYGTNGQIGTSHLKPLCEHPSFILGRKGAYRGVHYSDTPFSVIDTAFYAKPISDKVDLKWAYYKFLTYDINRMDSGSAIPSTDRYEIYSIDVDLPDLVTQRRVVSVLELLDNKIQDNNKINDNLAVLKFDGGYIQFAGHQFGQKRIPQHRSQRLHILSSSKSSLYAKICSITTTTQSLCPARILSGQKQSAVL